MARDWTEHAKHVVQDPLVMVTDIRNAMQPIVCLNDMLIEYTLANLGALDARKADIMDQASDALDSANRIKAMLEEFIGFQGEADGEGGEPEEKPQPIGRCPKCGNSVVP